MSLPGRLQPDLRLDLQRVPTPAALKRLRGRRAGAADLVRVAQPAVVAQRARPVGPKREQTGADCHEPTAQLSGDRAADLGAARHHPLGLESDCEHPRPELGAIADQLAARALYGTSDSGSWGLAHDSGGFGDRDVDRQFSWPAPGSVLGGVTRPNPDRANNLFQR